jgi:hypothetical protein
LNAALSSVVPALSTAHAGINTWPAVRLGPLDGSDRITRSLVSFKAVNHRDRNFTSAKLERCMKDIEASLGRYLAAMDTADRHEPTVAKATTEWLQDKIAALKEQMRILKEVEVQLNDAPDKKVSLTDPPPARGQSARQHRLDDTSPCKTRLQICPLQRVNFTHQRRKANLKHRTAEPSIAAPQSAAAWFT